MIIDKILEFQTADMKLFKLEKELRDSVEYKKVELYEKNIAGAADTVKKFDLESGDIISSYDRINENITQAEKNIGELVSAIKSISGATGRELNEYEYYMKRLEKAGEILVNNEKEIDKIKRRITEILTNTSKLLKGIQEAGEKKKIADAEFKKIRNLKKVDADALIKEIARLKAELPQEILDLYKTVKDEKKLPVFVKLLNKGQCSGCGMDLPMGMTSKLKNPGDYSECPNCRRIIYMN
jgi:predicted  nucleic acid-binding Zn-ribbon protein